MIGKRLKIARVNADLTQLELGIRAGLDEDTSATRISQYERGVHLPDFTLVTSFAKILNIPVPYFYTEDEELATIILQYHRYKKENPTAFVTLTRS